MGLFPCTTDAPHGVATQRSVRQPGHRLSTLCLIASCGFFLLAGLGGCDTRETATPLNDTPLARDVEPFDSSGAPPRDHTAEDIPRIVAFGNSLTAGLGVSPNHAYPAQLQNQLHAAGYHYDVINAGVSGETTAGGLRRVPWILKSRPSMVIVELGANDALRGHPLSTIESNLRHIIERLREGGAVVVLAGMQIPPNYGLDYTTGFASLFERLAREQAVILIPFFLEGVAAQKTLNQADGIHPTGEGYRIVARTVFEVIEPLLKKAKPDSERPRALGRS